jgi:hypothetical protein
VTHGKSARERPLSGDGRDAGSRDYGKLQRTAPTRALRRSGLEPSAAPPAQPVWRLVREMDICFSERPCLGLGGQGQGRSPFLGPVWRAKGLGGPCQQGPKRCLRRLAAPIGTRRLLASSCFRSLELDRRLSRGGSTVCDTRHRMAAWVRAGPGVVWVKAASSNCRTRGLCGVPDRPMSGNLGTQAAFQSWGREHANRRGGDDGSAGMVGEPICEVRG